MASRNPPGSQKKRRVALAAAGGRWFGVELAPETCAALAQLRARGAKSDAAAVNAAVVAHEEATR